MTAEEAAEIPHGAPGGVDIETDLDAMLERYQQHPGALAVDNWKFYRQLFEETERAEHPDITDSHGRVWTWFRSNAWTNANDPHYTHCAVVAAVDEIPHWGFPGPRVADNPNYRLCGTCRRDWPADAQELYAQVEALRSACGICRRPFEMNEWSSAMAYECQANDLWTFAHPDCRERAFRPERGGA